MASFVKPCSCINFHFLSHRKYRKYDWGPNSFLSRRSQSPLEWSGGRGWGYRRPSETLLSLGCFCASPRRSSKVWGLQPRVSGPLVAQSTATCLQKAQGSGEHMQLKVFFFFGPFSRQKIKRAKSPRTFYCYFFIAFPRFAAPRSLRLGRAKGQTGPVSPAPEKGLNCLFKRCWETHKKSPRPGG